MLGNTEIREFHDINRCQLGCLELSRLSIIWWPELHGQSKTNHFFKSPAATRYARYLGILSGMLPISHTVLSTTQYRLGRSLRIETHLCRTASSTLLQRVMQLLSNVFMIRPAKSALERELCLPFPTCFVLYDSNGGL